MNKMTEEIWLELENRISNKYPLLAFHSVLTEKECEHLPKSDSRKSIYTLHHRNYHNDVVLGTRYDILFLSGSPEKYIKINSEIDYTELKANQPVTAIPAGYGGICRITFEKGIPSEVKDLEGQMRNKPSSWEAYKIVYLTTQEVMNEILDILRLQKAE